MNLQILDRQQNYSEETNYNKKQQNKKNLVPLQCFDNQIYGLSILLTEKEQHSRLLMDSLQYLIDNTQNHMQSASKNSRFQTTAKFSLKKLYFQNLFAKRLFLLDNLQQSLFKDENSQSLYIKITEALQLQMKQQIANVLMFETQFEQNNKFFLAASQISFDQEKKLIFINLSDLHHNDQKQKLNYQYINLTYKKQEKQVCGCDKNYLNIYLNYMYNKVLSWDQLKLIYRLQIKKVINKYTSNIFVLQIANSFNQNQSTQRYIRFDEDCLRRMINKFCKLAQDKLIIQLVLLDQENGAIQQEEYNSNLLGMVKFLNCIQQGVIGNNVKSKVDFDIEIYKNQNTVNYRIWLQDFIKIQIQAKLDPIILNMYEREYRNLQLNSTIKNTEEVLSKSILLILNKQESHTKAYLWFEQKQLQFLFNSLLHLDYFYNLLVLLQQEESDKKKLYYLYYSVIQGNQSNIQCQRILLNQYVDDIILIDSHKKASLSVKGDRSNINQRLIYIHSLNSDVILEIQCFNNPSLKILRRNINYQDQTFQQQKFVINDQSKISNLVQNRRGPYVVQNSPFSQTDFMLIGGEFSNDPKICNIMEIVKLDQKTELGFYSYILSKEVVFEKGSFVPWPYMFVLQSNLKPYEYIFLPGDYNNQINCYNKPIVNTYQNYAFQLNTLKDNFQFKWKKLSIIYDNSNLGNSQPIPIQYFSGYQSNILCMEDSKTPKWIIAKTINKQIQFGSKGKMENYKCIEDLDSNISFKDVEQIIITAQLYVQENKDNLIIKEKFYYTQQQLIYEKSVFDLNKQDVKMSE